MALLRSDIDKALDEIASYEEGMRFQGLAVVLGKMRWPELIAHQRKKDLGLDAYALPSQTPEKVGKGLAASITPTRKKVSRDAERAKENFPDLGMLLFVTSGSVGNTDRRRWGEDLQKDHGVELHVIDREEIITQMMMPENASLCASFLRLEVDAEPQVAVLIEKTKRAAGVVVQNWAAKIRGRPLISLTAVRLDSAGAESSELLSLEQVEQGLSRGSRIVLEATAGRGKTTSLVQLAQRACTAGIPFMVDLPGWMTSRRAILEYIAGSRAFQAEGITPANLARVLQAEPILLLLNGWNEIAASSSVAASDALRELERDFPSAGIIVATRTHHLTPPLPGALRLRLLRLRSAQRADYLAERLGTGSAELRRRIDGDSSLDELTRTPFILSEVASLFEAGAEIPCTRFRVVDQVLRLQEERDEHKNSLELAPVFGQHTDYLTALANDMTRRGAVDLSEADARTVVAAVAQDLADTGQIEAAGAPAILAELTAHHVLERVDYPETAFRFDHQQLQEYYTARDLRARLLDLSDDDDDAASRFTADYVNHSVWDEPLRLIAETLAEEVRGTNRRNVAAGGKLVKMALAVDPVFAGELARLCGAAVWNEVRPAVGERLRAIYAMRDGNYRQYALAAMLATGADDFSDIILPLLSGQDRQAALRAYRWYPDFQVSSLGPSWRDQVRGWSDRARAVFVSELLHRRVDYEIAAFAAEDESAAVKRAAVSGLMWTGSDDVLTLVLESMDAQTFEKVARKNADRMPAAIRPRTIAALRKFVEGTTDHPARLRSVLDLIELGEVDLAGVVKAAMAALSRDDIRARSHSVRPALEYLGAIDPAWVGEWVASRVAEGSLDEHWLSFATTIPDDVVERCLQRLETEDFSYRRFEGMVRVIAARSDERLAARVFSKLRDLRRKIDAESVERHEPERRAIHQLQVVFRGLPDDVAVAGVLSSVTNGDPVDIEIAADLFSRVARSGIDTLRITHDDLRVRLRAYLKGSVDLTLGLDDFDGGIRANLASSLAQVGEPEDMADLVALIRADIERVRRGRAARAAGDHGPRGQGGSMSYARWHIAAILHLDAVGADQVLMELLLEPEYRSDVADAMARDFVPKPGHSLDRTFRHDLMWAAREGQSPPRDGERRAQFAAAISAEISRLRQDDQGEGPAGGLSELAKALASVDARGFAAAVLDVIAISGEWDHHDRLDAAERLTMAGVVLPAATAFALVDSILERTEDRDRYLLRRGLALCPFVDDPAAGIAKMRDVLGTRRLRPHELREFVTALGESRSDAAVDLLCELASDAQTFEQCKGNLIGALATLDTPRTRELLLGSVDPGAQGIALTRRPHREDGLVVQLADLARRMPEAATRLRGLCEVDLPEPNRHVLSIVMGRLGTSEALAASLNLIDDAKASPIPQGIREELEGAFVERRPYGQFAFTQHARASNELRARLSRMAVEDPRRRESAFMLLGQIELWRLEHGRPTDEPRHPDFGSGRRWPLGP